MVSNLQPRKPGEKLKVLAPVFVRKERNLVVNAERAKKFGEIKKSLRRGAHVKRMTKPDSLIANARSKKYSKFNALMSKLKPHKFECDVTSPVLLVVRNERTPQSYEVKSGLHSMGIPEASNMCQFVANTEDNRKSLAVCSPYVYYGVPSRKLVADLVTRKGHVKIQQTGETYGKVPISGNAVVTEAWGASAGFLCVEDVVDSILEGSGNLPMFLDTVSKLYPFQLASSQSKLRKVVFQSRKYQTRGFVKNLESFVSKML